MNETIGDRYEAVTGAVAAAARSCGRQPDAVRLVAVSKRKPASAVVEAFEAGARDFGESYVQELLEKAAEVRGLLGERADEVRWHFIGGLQSRKVALLGEAALVHSVCRDSQLRRFSALPGTSAILVQANLSGEASKDGLPADAVADFVAKCLVNPQVEVRGLMTMAAPRDVAGDAGVSEAFTGLAELLARCRDRFGDQAGAMTELSMGMSGDYELAIAAGATLVRIGTAIFGARP